MIDSIIIFQEKLAFVLSQNMVTNHLAFSTFPFIGSVGNKIPFTAVKERKWVCLEASKQQVIAFLLFCSVFRSWNPFQVANLKAELEKAGKPSGFAKLDSNGRLPHKLLEAGYDKYSAYDLAWQSLHMAAAAACRGSTASGGSGTYENKVITRNAADRKTCAQICAQTIFRNCDAEVSIYGKKGRATHNGMIVGAFYNYGCNEAIYGGSEASSSDKTVMNYGSSYFSFCCCRK